jgi:glycosyltransferase involved in cell wall biosynthesis
MHIALVYPSLVSRGGSQRYVLEIANNLQRLGIQVDLFCYSYNKDLCYPELTRNLNIFTIHEERVNSDNKTKQKSIKAIFINLNKNKNIKSIVNSLGLDYLASIYFTKINAKALSKLIWQTKKKYDLTFAHEEPLSVWAAIQYKKDTTTPIYWFCYDTIQKWYLEWKDEHKSSKVREILLNNFYFKYDKYIVKKHIDKMAVLDNNMLNRVEKFYDIEPLIRRGGIPEEVLNYQRKNHFREKYSLAEDTIVIFSLTRFVKYRRVHDIFEMYRMLSKEISKKIFIYINAPVGDQDYYNECIEKYDSIINSKQVVIDLNYPNSDQEMYNMYLSSDIFMFPNENQTWGHAPLEAMGCGSIAVVSSGCGIYEIMKNITPDTTYEVGNIESLTQRVSTLINEKSVKYQSIQREYVENNLTWNKICKQYIKDFNMILKNIGK